MDGVFLFQGDMVHNSIYYTSYPNDMDDSAELGSRQKDKREIIDG